MVQVGARRWIDADAVKVVEAELTADKVERACRRWAAYADGAAPWEFSRI